MRCGVVERSLKRPEVRLLTVVVELPVDKVEGLLGGSDKVEQVVAAIAVRILQLAVFVTVAAGEGDVVPGALVAIVGPDFGFDSASDVDGDKS
jgi:hypothetical protein